MGARAAKIDDDHWMLYYTAQLAGTAARCARTARTRRARTGRSSTTSTGPIICPDSTLWAIDPYPVTMRTATGTWSRASTSRTASTRSRSASSATYGQHFAPGSDWVKLTQITKGGWEEPVMENAAMVRLDGSAGTSSIRAARTATTATASVTPTAARASTARA